MINVLVNVTMISILMLVIVMTYYVINQILYSIKHRKYKSENVIWVLQYTDQDCSPDLVDDIIMFKSENDLDYFVNKRSINLGFTDTSEGKGFGETYTKREIVFDG